MDIVNTSHLLSCTIPPQVMLPYLHTYINNWCKKTFCFILCEGSVHIISLIGSKVGHNRSTSCAVDDTAGCDLTVVDDGLSSNMADSQ